MKRISFFVAFTVVSGIFPSSIVQGQDVEWALNDNNVGIGTGSPQSKLHVKGDSNVKLLVENSDMSNSNDRVLFELLNASPSKVRFAISTDAGASKNTWTFDNTPALDTFSISKVGTGLNEFSIKSNGDGTFRGRSFATNHINTSSRELKTDFMPVDELDVLEKLSHLPISSWRYLAGDEGERHVGPVAEDFQAVFDLGDGKTISTVDASGITFAAIKGLIEKLEARDLEIETLYANLKAQQERISQLEKDMVRLNAVD